MNIYVGNLSYDASEDDVREAFSAYGDVTMADRLATCSFVPVHYPDRGW